MRDNLFLGMNYNYRFSKIQVPFHYNQFWCITFIDRDNKQRLPWVLFFGPDLTNGKMTLHINALCVRVHGTKTVDASFNASAKVGDTETQAFFREGSSQGFGTHFFKYSEDFTYSLDSQSDWKPPE